MILKKGSTDITQYFNLVTTAGAVATGLTIADLDISYVRNRAAAVKADLTTPGGFTVSSAHADNAAIEVDGTNCPGLYRFDFPDAAFLTGVDKVQLVVNGAAIYPASIEVELVDYDPADGVRLGLTALPNAAAAAAGGLPVSTAGGLDLDAILADTNELQADDYPTSIAAIKTVVDTIQADTDLLDDVSGGLADIHTDIAAVKAETALIVEDTGTTLPATLAGDFNATQILTINAQVDAALNTAIPGSPTADSINQRIVALDVLTEASGNGDLAAIKTSASEANAHAHDIDLVTAKLDTALVVDGAVYQLTANALELAPSGGLDAAGIRGAIGMASANLDTQIAGIVAGSGLDAAGVRAAIGMASANLDTQISTAQADLDKLTGEDGATLATLQALYAPAKAGDVMGKSPATLAVADVTGNLPVDLKAITVGVDFSAAMKTSLNSATPAVTVSDKTGFKLASNGMDSVTAPDAASALAIIKAKTDQLTFTVTKRVDSTSSHLGNGAIAHTYTIATALGVAIPDVRVFVYSDVALATLIAVGTTNNSGQVVFYLDAGTYYFVCEKAGVTFTDNPDIEVVV